MELVWIQTYDFSREFYKSGFGVGVEYNDLSKKYFFVGFDFKRKWQLKYIFRMNRGFLKKWTSKVVPYILKYIAKFIE